jgi:hypothetical protein
MPTTLINAIVLFRMQVAPSTIYFTPKDGFEDFVVRLAFVHLVAVIEKLLDAKHVAMVCYGHATHPVLNSLVN